MLSTFFWIIGIFFLAIFVFGAIFAIYWLHRVRHAMRQIQKSFDPHPASPTRKEVEVIESKTVESNRE